MSDKLQVKGQAQVGDYVQEFNRMDYIIQETENTIHTLQSINFKLNEETYDLPSRLVSSITMVYRTLIHSINDTQKNDLETRIQKLSNIAFKYETVLANDSEMLYKFTIRAAKVYEELLLIREKLGYGIKKKDYGDIDEKIKKVLKGKISSSLDKYLKDALGKTKTEIIYEDYTSDDNDE